MASLPRSAVPHLAASLLATRAGVTASRAVRRTPSHRALRCEQFPAARAWFASTGRYRHASSKGDTRPAPRIPPPPPPLPVVDRHDVLHDTLSPHEPNRNRPGRSFTIYFWGVSFFAFLLSAYLGALYMSYKKEVAESALLDLAQNADVSSRWMDLSRNFDDEVDTSEKLMRLAARRRDLCRQAQGNVLEVSVGTGRNMELYDLDPIMSQRHRRIKSLVFNDQSEIMVYQAQKKFEQLQHEREAAAKFRGPVTFVVGDAGDKRVIARPAGGFDTIVQTMGVCSMPHPVGFLKRLGELCRQPGEEGTGVDVTALLEQEQQDRTRYGGSRAADGDAKVDRGGKILLLEHGRSDYAFINRYLDNIAKRHADRYGCWWNKDIDQIIRDSELVVESKRRYHFGTTYEYVLRPRGQTGRRLDQGS